MLYIVTYSLVSVYLVKYTTYLTYFDVHVRLRHKCDVLEIKVSLLHLFRYSIN